MAGIFRYVIIISLILSTTMLTSCGLIDTNPVDEKFIDYRNPSAYLSNTTNVTENVTEIIDENGTITIIEKPFIQKNISIASFNLDQFGSAKSSNSFVMNELYHIISNYDIIVLQEIINNDGTAKESLMNKFQNYGFVFSESLGQTKEKYAVMYKKDLFTIGKSYTWEDQTNIFERPPQITQIFFQDKNFIIVNIHINQDDAQEEIRHMRTVYNSVTKLFDTNKIIMIGDWNADIPYYSGDELIDYHWLITDDYKSDLRTKYAYNRIVYKSQDDWNVNDYGVDYYDRRKLSKTILSSLSDRYLVFMEVEI